MEASSAQGYGGSARRSFVCDARALARKSVEVDGALEFWARSRYSIPVSKIHVLVNYCEVFVWAKVQDGVNSSRRGRVSSVEIRDGLWRMCDVLFGFPCVLLAGVSFPVHEVFEPSAMHARVSYLLDFIFFLLFYDVWRWGQGSLL